MITSCDTETSLVPCSALILMGPLSLGNTDRENFLRAISLAQLLGSRFCNADLTSALRMSVMA